MPLSSTLPKLRLVNILSEPPSVTSGEPSQDTRNILKGLTSAEALSDILTGLPLAELSKAKPKPFSPYTAFSPDIQEEAASYEEYLSFLDEPKRRRKTAYQDMPLKSPNKYLPRRFSKSHEYVFHF
jgi:hypothetical protein